MDSYGEILKKAREERGLDYDTISREILITSQYLKGLEEEDNSEFPGEAYMVGFLKTYAKFLGLDSEHLLALFRGKKLQESPVPEGLIIHEKPRYFWPLIISAISVFCIALIVVGSILFIRFKSNKDAQVVLDNSSASKIYELTDKVFFSRVYVGDKFKIQNSEGEFFITVSDTFSSFALQCPVGTLRTELAEESELDIDGDTVADLIVYVSDISTANVDRGAEVRILRRSSSNYISAVNQDDIPFASEIGSSHKHVVILEDNRAYPFTLNGSFRGSCVFRYKIDRRDSVESYYASGEVVTMTANNGIRLWMSNCNTLKLSIVADSKSYDLEIGRAGQVLAEDIKWIKDTDGRYKLVVIELD